MRSPLGTSDNGFTLVEVAIVVLIIGLLAYITLPVFTSARQRAFDAAALSDLRGMTSAIELYVSTNTGYPGTPGELAAFGHTGSADVEVLRFDRVSFQGRDGIEIQVAHARSDSYFRMHYPGDGIAQQLPRTTTFRPGVPVDGDQRVLPDPTDGEILATPSPPAG